MQTRDNIKVVCFDFDGTIAATMPFLTDLAVEVLEKHCRLESAYAREQYIRTTGLPFEEQAARICRGDGTAVRAAVAEFERRKKSGYLSLEPEKHARETIAGLQRRGFTVAISSSTYENLIRTYLTHFGLSADLVMGLKPNFKKGRDHFDHIRQHCDVQQENICYVADSINDYHVAASCGVDFIAKCGLFDPADFQALEAGITVINDLEELLAIFKSADFSPAAN